MKTFPIPLVGSVAWSCARILAVVLGGGLGSVLRFLAQFGFGLAAPVPHQLYWSFSKLLGSDWFSLGVVNCFGCFCIGAVSARVSASDQPLTHAFLVTGLLGGFTSFSAFVALLTVSESAISAMLYVVIAFCTCLAGVWLGRKATHALSRSRALGDSAG